MNTKIVEQFEVLNVESLSVVEGGALPLGPVIKGLGIYVAGKIFDGVGKDSTKSCQQNPKQWFCFKV
ncbi:hypothetical protein [Streptococcus thoraltensis]|uniref:hypothetical protein n=1 Tax=Streptococcus thoraltensis TaxID=55085 RepID=UPI0003818CA6|nr:hypothetical protein [Streptococcus thoraltensis]MDY4760519.1 bacteriocin [Streptococcus thoraltensis]